MLVVHVINGRFEEALELLIEMLESCGALPDFHLYVKCFNIKSSL